MSENGGRRAHVAAARKGDGYFPPESMIRRIAATPLVNVLGVAPTVLYQSAHPLVAAGIVEHANYRGGHWQRWRNVVRASNLIVFGSRADADAAAEGVRAIHARINGTTAEPLGSFPAGTRYAADDPELVFWVTTSLMEVTAKLYGRYVRRLSIGDRERYYRDMRRFAKIIGATEEVMPKSLADYRVFLHERLTGSEVSVTSHARAIATAILEGPLPFHFRLLSPVNRLASAGLLPPRLREEYGLPWSAAHGLALAASAVAVTRMGGPVALAAGMPRPSGA